MYVIMSPSLRGRGLKYIDNPEKAQYSKVALFARAWIEIAKFNAKRNVEVVALFARAWIEMLVENISDTIDDCRPLCEGVD